MMICRVAGSANRNIRGSSRKPSIVSGSGRCPTGEGISSCPFAVTSKTNNVAARTWSTLPSSSASWVVRRKVSSPGNFPSELELAPTTIFWWQGPACLPSWPFLDHDSRYFMSSSRPVLSSQRRQPQPPPPSSESEEGPTEGGGCGGSPAAADRRKSPDQMTEEEILSLQSEIRVHYKHAHYTKALEVSQDLLTKCLEHFTKAHPATASAHNNVGLMCKMLGDYDNARKHYHDALRIYEQVVGKDHASYAAALNNLGNLHRFESNTDDRLSHLDRLSKNETAIQYFEEALAIRTVELGLDHPHTIISKTNLGSAIAAQVLSQHAHLRRMAERDQLQKQQQQQVKEKQTLNSYNSTEENEGTVVKKTQASTTTVEVLKPSKFTQKRWRVAEEHLRGALKIAIQNPRGEKVALPDRTNLSSTTNTSSSLINKVKNAHGTKKKKHNKRGIKGISKAGGGNTLPPPPPPAVDKKEAPYVGGIQTLSAATAAQNLAVFLKSRADVLRETATSSSSSSSTGSNDNTLDPEDMYAEARQLYTSALHVRTQLLGQQPNHPDIITTKFSFAELLSTLGNEKEANLIRQDILNAYDVVEKDALEVEGQEDEAMGDEGTVKDETKEDGTDEAEKDGGSKKK